jgi:hypothetical protein
MRRMIKKARIQDATIARKPRTTITAIAQCGNPEPEEADCTLPDEEVGAVLMVVREASAEDDDAAAAAAEDAEDAEAEEAATT